MRLAYIILTQLLNLHPCATSIGTPTHKRVREEHGSACQFYSPILYVIPDDDQLIHTVSSSTAV